MLRPIRCLLLLLHPAEIKNVRFYTMKDTKYRNKTCMHSCAQTNTILTRNSFPNSSPLWAWIILISPLPFSKLCLANLLVPLNLTYDTFHITRTHTIPTHFYPKTTGRVFFQNTDVQLQVYLMSQTRTLSSETFCAPYLQEPILDIFLCMLSKHLVY